MTSRSFIATLNNPETPMQEYYQRYMDAGAKYIVGQKEKGENGTEHYQFYVNFKSPVRVSKLKKICEKAHFEKCESVDASIKYVQKEDTRMEGPISLGEAPFRPQEQKEKWEDIWESAKQGDFEAIPAKIRIKHYNTIKQIHKDHLIM